MQRIRKDMPTEMKLIYDTKSGKFKAEYEYDLIHTNDDIKRRMILLMSGLRK